MSNRTRSGSIWLHAVSVGEVMSAVALLKALRQQLPDAPLYLSTSTVAGRKAAARVCSGLLDGFFYAPIDYVSCVRRTLTSIRPRLLIVLETEIWPNLYAEAKRAGCGIAIVNGRISDRAWPRYKRSSRLFRPVLALADMVAVQSVTDRERYSLLGVPGSKISVENNLKYDAAANSEIIELDTFGARQIVIAASTAGPNEHGSVEQHSIDEDDVVIRAFQKLAVDFSGLLLILAPRQPARFEAVAEKLMQSGIPFIRRTAMTGTPARTPRLTLPGILLLDTIGELAHIYQVANVVFVGGSLAPRGGHNIIEPAAACAPIIVGPHMQNFEGITRDFLDADAIVQIPNEAALYEALDQLLRDEGRARTLGFRAQQVAETRRGGSKQIAERLADLYFASHYRAPRNLLTRVFLNALAQLWLRGGEIKRNRSLALANTRPPLAVPVISIGGITVGGSGKTPFTVCLATQLKAAGYSPAILTRGYKRRSRQANIILPIGSTATVAITGDEAQIFLRAKVGAVGIGNDRYQTAQILLDRVPQTDILLLDDGFQHAQIGRDLDIVLVDGLDPFGGYNVVPAGRLREPLSALSRANILVVTRAASEAQYEAICTGLRLHNAQAPIFRAELKVNGWRIYPTGQLINKFPSGKVVAFCGLGNPSNFFNTLESLGLDVVFRHAFRDHHRYTVHELARLAHQAQVHLADTLVTTEKDCMNLPENFPSALKGLQIAFLDIEMKPVEEEEFLTVLADLLALQNPGRIRNLRAPADTA